MKRNLEQRGITLIALVVTIIVMIILAGVSMYLLLGDNGMIKMADKADKEYKQAKQNEEKALEKLYSSIQIAGDSKVTLSTEELDEYINKKVDERLNATKQATGLRTDAAITDAISQETSYTNVTTMSGYTRGMDKDNHMLEYVSYSNEDGYTVLKERMVFSKYECLCKY